MGKLSTKERRDRKEGVDLLKNKIERMATRPSCPSFLHGEPLNGSLGIRIFDDL